MGINHNRFNMGKNKKVFLHDYLYETPPFDNYYICITVDGNVNELYFSEECNGFMKPYMAIVDQQTGEYTYEGGDDEDIIVKYWIDKKDFLK